MAQVTIYIPNDLETKIKTMAKSLDLSISKFITNTLKQKVKNEWSSDTVGLSGSWSNFPPLEEIRETRGKDINREAF
jgi:hypothetical protein